MSRICSGYLYEFLWLCFGLKPAYSFFSKTLKVSTLLLRQLSIRPVIYLDDTLLIGKTVKEILTHYFFLFQNLFFSFYKSENICSRPDIVFRPKNRDGSSTTALALTAEKMDKTTLKCQNFLTNFPNPFLEIRKLVVLML